MKKKLATALSIARKIAVTPAHVARREEPPAGDEQHDAQEQVDPAPGRGIEVERVVLRDHEELVLEDRGEAGDDLERADEGEDAGGEREPARRPAGDRRVDLPARLDSACRSCRKHPRAQEAVHHPARVIRPHPRRGESGAMGTAMDQYEIRVRGRVTPACSPASRAWRRTSSRWRPCSTGRCRPGGAARHDRPGERARARAGRGAQAAVRTRQTLRRGRLGGEQLQLARAAHRLAPVGHVELAVDRLQVRLDRVDGHEQLRRRSPGWTSSSAGTAAPPPRASESASA